jgi:predicted ATPase
MDCSCPHATHPPRFIVLTGGPGAGKTAALEVIRRDFCRHVVVLPEAAGIVFGGGFPRRATLPARRAAQRAIFHVQRELEAMAVEEQRAALVLCDRGSLDGLAYWPGPPGDFAASLGIRREAELARYAAVLHLRTPAADGGYNRDNPIRLETAAEAAAIDERILEVWADHPRRTVVASTPEFLDKLRQVVALVAAEVPACCRGSADAPPPR